MKIRSIWYSFIAFFCWIFSIAWAINIISEGFSTTTEFQEIDAHGVCHAVRQTWEQSYFVPTRSSEEWQSFRNNLPWDIELSSCGISFMNSCLFHTSPISYSFEWPSSGTQFSVSEYSPSSCHIWWDNMIKCLPSTVWNKFANYANFQDVQYDKLVWNFLTENGYREAGILKNSYCGIRTSDKNILCFWDPDFSVLYNNIPSWTFKDVFMGSPFYACGIRPDDTIACWGDFVQNNGGVYAPNYQSTWTVPSPSWQVESLFFSKEWLCVLFQDTSISCYGQHQLATQIQSFSWPIKLIFNVANSPSSTPLDQFDIATCALYTDGTVECLPSEKNGDDLSSYFPDLYIWSPTVLLWGIGWSCLVQDDLTTDCGPYNVFDPAIPNGYNIDPYNLIPWSVFDYGNPLILTQCWIDENTNTIVCWREDTMEIIWVEWQWILDDHICLQ